MDYSQLELCYEVRVMSDLKTCLISNEPPVYCYAAVQQWWPHAAAEQQVPQHESTLARLAVQRRVLTNCKMRFAPGSQSLSPRD